MSQPALTPFHHSALANPTPRTDRCPKAHACCRFMTLCMLVLLSLLYGKGVCAASPEISQPSPDVIRQWQQKAAELDLARTPMWRTLVHYRTHPVTRQVRSLADDPGFFLAPDGADNPEAELNATLSAMFDPRTVHALDQPAACRFIARQRWLRSALQIDHEAWPAPDCPRFEQWRSALRADKVSLIFPSAYLNSPASMYGHTFLRLDPAPARGNDEPATPLLSYAINYAANAHDSEGIAYALKGLFGLYPGQFTNAPYYLRIREYNDLENRDIWEYELNLTPEEIERLLAHTWELGPTRFDYFFIDENCSYHLLALLDAARPGWGLADRFTWWAIPVDTIRAVADTPGLLKAVHYRPANSTELTARAQALGPEDALLARQLANGEWPPSELAQRLTDPHRQTLALEAAERLVAFDAVREGWPESLVHQRRLALLQARAALPSGQPIVVPRPSHDPTQGHATARFDLMTGQRAGRPWLTVSARPAYHDLLDPAPGYQAGAAINFFQLSFSRADDGALRFERLTPVDITSLSPREPLLKARSWRVAMHLRRDPFEQRDTDRHVGAELRGGPGWAWHLDPQQHTLGYAFMDNHAQWDRARASQPWALGSGLAAGLLWHTSPRWSAQVEGYARAYLGSQPEEWGWTGQVRLHPHPDWSVQMLMQSMHRDGQGHIRTWGLGLMRHW